MNCFADAYGKWRKGWLACLLAWVGRWPPTDRPHSLFVDDRQMFERPLKVSKSVKAMRASVVKQYSPDCWVNSPKLPNVAAWQLLNQLGSKILLRFPFVLGRCEAGFDSLDIWHSPISVWQLPECLLAENLLHK
jgi:hypothetical protein